MIYGGEFVVVIVVVIVVNDIMMYSFNKKISTKIQVSLRRHDPGQVRRVCSQICVSRTSTQNTPNFSFWSFFFHLLSSHHHSHHRHMTRDSIQILLFFSRSILSCCCHHRDYSLYLSVFENVNRVIYLVCIRFTVEFGSDLEHSRTEHSFLPES